ncbi:hypothetical protein B484DRAFT_410929 [Ochromonadaceae sp. CCMP2298]|nr:hypothetical protein B484DRAFT_410929 [Ochromonadaceae sp. CCMP2298]
MTDAAIDKLYAAVTKISLHLRAPESTVIFVDLIKKILREEARNEFLEFEFSDSWLQKLRQRFLTSDDVSVLLNKMNDKPKVLKFADRDFTQFSKRPYVTVIDKDCEADRMYIMLYQYGMADEKVEKAISQTSHKTTEQEEKKAEEDEEEEQEVQMKLEGDD